MRMIVPITILCGLIALTYQLSAQPGGEPPRGGPPGGGRGGPGGRAVTAEELVARVFQSDTDQDGKLSKVELTDARLSRLFARADGNSDGIVTQDELKALFLKELAATGAGPGGPANPGGRGGPREPGGRGGPPGGGPPRVGQILPPFVQESLDLTDDQRSQLEALQKEVDAKLDKILTPKQKQQLNKENR